MDMMSYLMGRNSGSAKKGAKIEVVTELPETGEANVIYLVPKQDEDENNVFDEYLYINDEWELIGSTAIDISGKQDTMQFSTMPTASADTIGKIVQYVGATTNDYTNGYFYIGVTDGTNYSWENIPSMGYNENDRNVFFYENNQINDGYTNGSISFNVSDAKQPILDFLNKNIGKNAILCLRGTFGYESLIFLRTIGNTSSSYEARYIKLPRTGDTGLQENTYFAISYVQITYNQTQNKITNISFTGRGGTQYVSTSTMLRRLGLSAYLTSKTYQVGDYVYHSSEDTVVYKCNTADTTGTWNFAKWTEVTLFEYLNNAILSNIDLSTKQDVMQYSAMPTASASTVGKIVQYTGTTDSNYTNGYFYVCVGTTENDVTTYSWSNVEVQEKSKSYPVYVAKLSVGVGGTGESGSILTDSDMNIVSNIITDAYQKGYEHIILQLEGNSSSNKYSVLLTCCSENIQNKPVSINFCGMDKGGSRFLDNSLPFIYSYQLAINIQWTNDVASKRGNSTYYAVSKAVLLTSNTAAYTPTGDYNPATKKYVDDSIAAAITTTLGGSY